LVTKWSWKSKYALAAYECQAALIPLMPAWIYSSQTRGART